MMNRSLTLRLRSNAPHLKSWVLGSLLILGGVAGILPSHLAHAQQAPGDLAQYTSVARLVERERMQAYAEVKRLMGGNVPDNVCQRGDIPQQVREICDRFDNSSRDIIQRNGMTISEFNKITRFCQQNPKPKDCPR